MAIDNQSDEELSLTHFSSPFDSLRLILWHDGLNVFEQPYGPLPPSGERRAQYYMLPRGETKTSLQFTVELAPGLGNRLDAQIMGTLPRSRFEGVLESNMIRIGHVEKADSD